MLNKKYLSDIISVIQKYKGAFMNILVTGGAGFIGSNFIYYELENHRKDKIICLDKLTYAGNLSTLENALKNKNFEFYRGDICDEKCVENIFESEKIDIVVNFAAESHVDRSISEPTLFFKTNVIGTQILLEACKKYGIKRFHQISTDEVYGELPLDRKDLLFTEETPLCASSPYSASKASADLLVMSYHKTFGLPVSVSRCSNNYGPYQFPEKLIPLIIMRAMSNEQIPIYGKGENVRDWIFAEDHCNAIDKIIRSGRAGEIYNIGANNERSNLEIVSTVLEKLKKPKSLISFVKDRPGHDLRYAVNSSKIQQELGWRAETDFLDGLEKTIEWYIQNEKWTDSIVTKEYENYFNKIYGSRF